MRFRKRTRTPRIDQFQTENAELLGWARGYQAGCRSNHHRSADGTGRADKTEAFDQVVTDLAHGNNRPVVTYGGYLPMCPHCRRPLSEKDVRRFRIGLEANNARSA
jgi:hypothetical protein